MRVAPFNAVVVTGNAQFVAGSIADNISSNNTNLFSLIGLFPNPVHDKLNVEFNSSMLGTANIKVYAVTGQLVFSKTMETTNGLNLLQLNTTGIKNGIYIFEMDNNGSVSRQRFVVEGK